MRIAVAQLSFPPRIYDKDEGAWFPDDVTIWPTNGHSTGDEEIRLHNIDNEPRILQIRKKSKRI